MNGLVGLYAALESIHGVVLVCVRCGAGVGLPSTEDGLVMGALAALLRGPGSGLLSLHHPAGVDGRALTGNSFSLQRIAPLPCWGSLAMSAFNIRNVERMVFVRSLCIPSHSHASLLLPQRIRRDPFFQFPPPSLRTPVPLHNDRCAHTRPPWSSRETSCCTSINEIVCHGIPDSTVLEEGMIVNVDVTVFYKGYHGDCSEMFLVGEVDQAAKDLVQVKWSLMFFVCRVRRTM